MDDILGQRFTLRHQETVNISTLSGNESGHTDLHADALTYGVDDQ